VRSAPGLNQYLTVCQAMDQEYTTLAYPATICMDCQAAEVTDDETSVETLKISQETLEKEMDGTRPVMPTEVEQMREEIFKGKETEAILLDEDETVEERKFSHILTGFTRVYALALQIEPSYTHSPDQDGKAKRVT
jgi:hypothetical protein